MEENRDFEMENQTQEPGGQPVNPLDIYNNDSDIDLSKVESKIEQIREECAKLIVGQEEMVEMMLISMLCDGHVLLEGVPGIAKTLSAQVLARTIDAQFSRIQFTPDLMPTDILGTSVFNMKESVFHFKKGPIFSNLVLIDEINRAPAKTQSALFEVMEERQISYDGNRYPMQFPFLIIATQNPVEQEGTYRLPEAQLDRFLMKLVVNYPNPEQEVKILERFSHSVEKPDLNMLSPVCSVEDLKAMQKILNEIYISPALMKYIVDIVHATREHGQLYLGASPRASLALMRTSKALSMLSGRSFVIPDDVKDVCPHVLNHRIILTPEAEMSGQSAFSLIDSLLREVEVPR
jgi:MoxR-like ATPase